VTEKPSAIGRISMALSPDGEFALR